MIKEIKEIQNGNGIILEKFIKQNDKYIDAIIEKYKNIFDDYEELKQEAIKRFIELLYVVDYNISKERFMQYFYARLTIGTRRYVFSNINRIKNVEDKYSLCLHGYDKCKLYLKHEPNYQELAKYLTVSRRCAFEILYIVNNFDKLIKEKIILDSKYNGFEEDLVSKIQNEEFKKIIKNILTKNQNKLISSRFGFESNDPETFYEIAKNNNVSPQSVQSNYEYAEKKLVKKLPNLWYDVKEYTKRKVLDNSETN